MSKNTDRFFVYGAPIGFLVESYRYRMNQRLLILSLPKGHTAEVIKLAEWKASREMPN